MEWMRFVHLFDSPSCHVLTYACTEFRANALGTAGCLGRCHSLVVSTQVSRVARVQIHALFCVPDAFVPTIVTILHLIVCNSRHVYVTFISRPEDTEVGHP